LERSRTDAFGRSADSPQGHLSLGQPEQLALPWQQSRRDRSRLRDALRAYAVSPRVARCGRSQIAPTVDICSALVDGRRVAFARGLLTCGSVWSCPSCSAKIRAGRAGEVQQVVEWHGQHRTFLWSLTVRHARGHSLERVRRGVARAMRLMQRGAPWRRFKARVGLVGSIRALEVTHGPNGWHPHLHALLLVERPDLLAMERAWLLGRWQSCVVAALGAAHTPNEHGSDLRPCTDSTYIAKLGLELCDGAKTGRAGHRTPWQIARDVADGDVAGDRVLWREYGSAMFGARMLTWSLHLRRAAGLLDEPTDLELAEAEPDGVAVATPLRMSRRLFRAIRGPDVLLALLEACETGGRPAVARSIVALFGARGRMSPPPRGPPMEVAA